MKKAKLFFSTLFLLIGMTLLAQNVQVSGVVSEPSGDAVTGAAVQLKGSTTVYTMTDVLGNYRISVPSNGTLVVSCLGFKTVEIPVNGRSVINVVLDVDSEMLEETIVVAYGTVRREANTGAVAALKNVTLAEAPVSSVDKLLQGKLAGVQVTANTGQPGANTQIRIRGISSINAGNEPLWVVDGIPVESGDQSYFTNTSNAISAINPNDIESITVLKDAAAASIYGSRAANGVVLVTTKSGRAGKANFNARVKFGASMLANDNHFRVMTGDELIDWQRTAITNAGFDPDSEQSPYYRPKSLLAKANTDWLKEFIRMGAMQEYEINASAGTDRGRFYSSLAYQKNDGISYGTDFQKFTARVNSDYRLTNTIEIGTRVNLAYTMSNDTPMQSLYYSNPFFAGLTILPWIPAYDENGEFNLNIPSNSNTNPRYTAKYDDQWEKQYRVHGTAYLQWEPVRNLIFKTNNSVETTFGEGRRYWAPDPGDTKGTLQSSTTQYITLTTSNTATYNFSLDNHSFNVLLGQEAMRRSYQYYYMYGDVDANIPYPNTMVSEKDEVSYSGNFRTLLSFFGQLDYNYDNRYYLKASVREDGSSLFGAESKWGLFWAVAGSWNITHENFMKSSANWLSLLKLRASYGVNGNNSIAPYRAYGVYATSAYNGTNGSLPSRPDNASLSWEKNYTWNVGLDAGFFDNRLNFQFDLYSRKTTDMLLDKQVPQTSGFSSNFMNIGSLANRGFEIQINGDIINSRDWNWSAGFNLSYNRSEVLDLGDTQEMNYPDDSRIKHKVGKQFYTFYLKDYYGVNPSNGEALWRHHEFDKDGNITSTTLTNDYNKASYIYAGSPEPKFTGGFNTNISWKGLSLSAFFEFKTGNKVLIVENRYINSDGSQMSMNQSARSLNYWKQPGDTGVFPKPVAGNSSNSYAMPSTRWMQDGSYLRIKDITLSYSLPTNVVKKIGLNALKVYASALNLYTFHDVDWWDPERGVTGMGTGVYPMTKSIVGGIEVSF
ncbi:TonB-linked outer membrane protein, SusC/RagA family [Bacteroidales bacterium WCE2004]|nr:TonB-linked outer membrane protein, SusC/RagA family [Bacteroidales bacterium WCE2004]